MLKKEKYEIKIKKESRNNPKEYWEKITEKRLKKTNQAVTKYMERELKRNKLSLEENLKNGVKLLEESYRTTNSEYWHEIKNKENEALKTKEGFIVYKISDNNNKDKNRKFIPWINNISSIQQIISLDTIEETIKKNLGIPKKSSIRYDNVKCSKNCQHNNHYYFYAYWWDSFKRNNRKKILVRIYLSH